MTWLVLARCTRPLAHMSRSRHALTRCTPLLALAQRTQLEQKQRLDVLDQGRWRRDDGQRAMFSTTGAGAALVAGAGAAYAITSAGGIHFTAGASVAYTAGAVVTHDATGAGVMYSTAGAGTSITVSAGAMFSTTCAQVPLLLQTTVSKPALQEHL